jgi:hypothetical protein
VATEFSRTAGNDTSILFRLSKPNRPEVVANGAYRALMRGSVIAVDSFMNWLGVQMLRISPRALVRRFVSWVNSTS